MSLKAAKALGKQEPLLTKYDTIVGDGDCGITMKRGATEVEERLKNGTISTEHPVTMFATIADAVSASMGGTSGVLLELMFRKMSSTLSRNESIGTEELCKAFRAGVDAISLYGGATVGSRTMLDALVPGRDTAVLEQLVEESFVSRRLASDNSYFFNSLPLTNNCCCSGVACCFTWCSLFFF